MKNKVLYVIYYIIMALPIPISLVSWIGTLISVADMGMTKINGIIEFIYCVVALLTMLLAGTYAITYCYSLLNIKKKKAIITLLPILHIIITGVMLFIWYSFE